ncbi:MAG: hypothetical protein NTW35_00050 [Candidatus Nomurabacteria bacterium]|nr:hypothetical protein [Candidatus Nomurabacteria bacterium]
MYPEVLSELGIARNESFIYISLVKNGGMGISKIAEKSGVHRRNVYDSMKRLLERGLVYEEVGDRENTYFAVDPKKLMEIVDEKRQKVENLMPELEKAFNVKASQDSVYIYRGVEGFKNCLRDMARSKTEVCLLGAAGISLDPEFNIFFNQIKGSLERKNIKVRVLYLEDVYKKDPSVIGHFGKTSSSRVLKKELTLPTSWVVLDDCVYNVTKGYHFKSVDSELMMTVVKNKANAESFRMLFDYIWKGSKIVK